MKIVTTFCCAVFMFMFVLSFTLVAQQAFAAPSVKAVARLEKRIERKRAKLRKSFARLSSEKKARVLEIRDGKSRDSDEDGVPDNIEDDNGTCDTDSDNDGVDDRDEYDNGTDPSDDDSDDDGHDDSSERNEKGLITQLSGSEIVVNAKSFLIVEGTEFQGKKHAELTLADFEEGDCVEVEGYVNNSELLIADKVAVDNDCSGDDD